MKPEVLGRLSALTGKRRSFVAQGASVPEAVRGDGEDDDLPILTEVVDISEVSGDRPNRHAGLNPHLEAMAAELSHVVQQRMASDLPALLDESLDRLAAELKKGIHQITEVAIRDYLARQAQLSLPLDGDAPKKKPR